jgi:hypothetical protein
VDVAVAGEVVRGGAQIGREQPLHHSATGAARAGRLPGHARRDPLAAIDDLENGVDAAAAEGEIRAVIAARRARQRDAR